MIAPSKLRSWCTGAHGCAAPQGAALPSPHPHITPHSIGPNSSGPIGLVGSEHACIRRHLCIYVRSEQLLSVLSSANRAVLGVLAHTATEAAAEVAVGSLRAAGTQRRDEKVPFQWDPTAPRCLPWVLHFSCNTAVYFSRRNGDQTEQSNGSASSEQP